MKQTITLSPANESEAFPIDLCTEGGRCEVSVQVLARPAVDRSEQSAQQPGLPRNVALLSIYQRAIDASTPSLWRAAQRNAEADFARNRPVVQNELIYLNEWSSKLTIAKTKTRLWVELRKTAPQDGLESISFDVVLHFKKLVPVQRTISYRVAANSVGGWRSACLQARLSLKRNAPKEGPLLGDDTQLDGWDCSGEEQGRQGDVYSSIATARISFGLAEGEVLKEVHAGSFQTRLSLAKQDTWRHYWNMCAQTIADFRRSLDKPDAFLAGTCTTDLGGARQIDGGFEWDAYVWLRETR